VNLLWTQKPPTRFAIETPQPTTPAARRGHVSNPIGRRINIPETIPGVHGLMGFTITFTSVDKNLSETVQMKD